MDPIIWLDQLKIFAPLFAGGLVLYAYVLKLAVHNHETFDKIYPLVAWTIGVLAGGILMFMFGWMLGEVLVTRRIIAAGIEMPRGVLTNRPTHLGGIGVLAASVGLSLVMILTSIRERTAETAKDLRRTTRPPSPEAPRSRPQSTAEQPLGISRAELYKAGGINRAELYKAGGNTLAKVRRRLPRD